MSASGHRRIVFAMLAVGMLCAVGVLADAAKKQDGATAQKGSSSSRTAVTKLDKRASSTTITIGREPMVFPHERGALWWRDEWGRRYYLIPANQRDRRLLKAGFVPYRMLPYYIRHSRSYRARSERPRPEINLYYINPPPRPRPKPPAQREARMPEVLRPRQAGGAEEHLYASRLSPMLGGKAEAGQSFALGENYLTRGMLKEAADNFRRAKLKQPDDAITALALGTTLLALGDFEGATAEIRRGLAHHHDPNKLSFDPIVAFGRAETYEKRMNAVAAKLFADPANGDLHLLLGFDYFATGQWEQAVHHLKAAEAADQTDPASARLRALAMGRMLEETEKEQQQAAPADEPTTAPE